mgnify:CR=1 FL=1
MCFKPKTVPESAKIKALIQQMRKIECRIDEAGENASTFDHHAGEINDKMREINRELSRCNTALAQYESALNLRQDDVIQALNSCEVFMLVLFIPKMQDALVIRNLFSDN